MKLPESGHDRSESQIDASPIDEVVHDRIQKHDNQYHHEDVIDRLDVLHLEEVRQQRVPRHKLLVRQLATGTRSVATSTTGTAAVGGTYRGRARLLEQLPQLVVFEIEQLHLTHQILHQQVQLAFDVLLQLVN